MPWYQDEESKTWHIRFYVYLFLFLWFVAIVLSYQWGEDKSTHQTVSQAEGWRGAKSVLYNVIYKDHHKTLYHGCSFSGPVIDLSTCKYVPVEREKYRATRVEAEHIVPASLLPARQLPCWNVSRNNCELNDPKAQAMLFDLHNLAPSVGQLNLLRGNKRYGETKGTFNPPDCVKGDVARVWLYMHLRHGVELWPGEKEMFEKWSKMDPVSPWEAERERRIRKYSFIANPYVKGQKPDRSGSCPWE